MGTYAYTHTDTNICKLLDFHLLSSLSYQSINNNNTYQLAYASLNDLL